jgi:hypothetical protein
VALEIDLLRWSKPVGEAGCPLKTSQKQQG